MFPSCSTFHVRMQKLNLHWKCETLSSHAAKTATPPRRQNLKVMYLLREGDQLLQPSSSPSTSSITPSRICNTHLHIISCGLLDCHRTTSLGKAPASPQLSALDCSKLPKSASHSTPSRFTTVSQSKREPFHGRDVITYSPSLQLALGSSLAANHITPLTSTNTFSPPNTRTRTDLLSSTTPKELGRGRWQGEARQQ
jgi:hypothetical protein